MDALKMALSFVKIQVKEKRHRLEELDKQTSNNRFSLRAGKNQILGYQEQIGTTDMRLNK